VVDLPIEELNKVMGSIFGIDIHKRTPHALGREYFSEQTQHEKAIFNEIRDLRVM
jgi:hypothetical protein